MKEEEQQWRGTGGGAGAANVNGAMVAQLSKDELWQLVGEERQA